MAAVPEGEEQTPTPENKQDAVPSSETGRLRYDTNGDSAVAERRLHRGLRKLEWLRQPDNVLSFLAAARVREGSVGLRAFK